MMSKKGRQNLPKTHASLSHILSLFSKTSPSRQGIRRLWTIRYGNGNTNFTYSPNIFIEIYSQVGRYEIP